MCPTCGWQIHTQSFCTQFPIGHHGHQVGVLFFDVILPIFQPNEVVNMQGPTGLFLQHQFESSQVFKFTFCLYKMKNNQ